MARSFRSLRAGGRLCSGATILAPRHRHFRYISGRWVKSLSGMDGTERQWDNVWPRTAEFRFDLENTMVMASPDGEMAVAITPWTSTVFYKDGKYVRPS